MAAGLQITKAEINATSGTVARSVFAVLSDVLEFKAWLDTVSANDLETTYGFATAEAADLKSAFADLADLAGIFNGSAAANTLPHDYRVFAKRLIGTGLY
ncbi:hypothetical protein ACIBI9_04185 [Nonomuraea sp. NPDC050451]|uniref:hypothetical protein n=1 Tax=Nonomuraea sp. NPDC050451 TaxID=3364364 RepID=UPI0037BB7E2B